MTDELRDWDITSGVGITALAVAAARAVDTTREDGLVRDPYAADFVAAAGAPVPMPVDAAALTTEDHMWDLMSTFMGVRSRFFDEYFAEAAEYGVRQAVILAAGLDCRAFRLDWPAGSTVFEVDQPRVLEFKDRVLAERNARPGARRRVVAVDLRDDWAAALLAEGFDARQPTAWLAEGLLPYLPDDAAIRMLDIIHELSAPGSTVALEHMANPRAMLDDPLVLRTVDEFGFDLSSLFAGGPEKNPAEYLSTLGWAIGDSSSGELAARYGKEFDDELADLFADNGRYVTARLL
ncbi:SAM-dependent methyltransferase [Amycolatopsis sp. K13G38]|uniref:S-adenosyl-L-methionine-dependent methyltransferase n=1 Tax=Amycolatopsis acididurans TaxID=2724524 RepID=A0ABX1J6E4_9PSEU|nr:SAM-dependent methyltransferase [Amycolatopsis acididurans]NKQ55313.1 SAM-dependent methyltransferase [Amycolatopsis acididurans]